MRHAGGSAVQRFVDYPEWLFVDFTRLCLKML
jgi:hypothetical protein